MTDRVLYDGELRYDACIYLENFENDLKDVFATQLGMKIATVPHKNKTNSKKPLTISEEAERLIEQRFADDFQNFGYSMRNK